MTECKNCGEDYKQLGLHWRGEKCDYPSLSQEKKEILTGLLMGDGCVSKNAETAHMVVMMTNREFLEHIDERMGYLTTGVKLDRTAEEQEEMAQKGGNGFASDNPDFSPLYKLTFRTHTFFNTLNEWYSTGEKVWPPDVTITPLLLKMLYVCDGNIHKDKRTAGSRPTIGITASNEQENSEKIADIFHRAGFEMYWSGDCISVTTDESQAMWRYMGSPPPGFEYKWPENFKA